MPQVSHKAALIDAATEVFHVQGFNASSVDDIVRAANVPKGSFYNHFPSKEALALEVTRRYAANTRVDMLAGEGSPLARLRAHFTFLVDRDINWGVDRGCVLGNFATELARQSPPVRDAVRDSYTHWSAAIASTIDEARAAGELPAGPDSRPLADFLIDAFEGATARAKVTSSRTPLDQFLSLTFTTLLPPTSR
jgi:TetR/AcrR family transcriptional regulator, transcriptional repressor for nem operon